MFDLGQAVTLEALEGGKPAELGTPPFEPVANSRIVVVDVAKHGDRVANHA